MSSLCQAGDEESTHDMSKYLINEVSGTLCENDYPSAT